jgi:molecular chaperone HtpG
MATEAKKETFGFQTEVKELLQLMIHSLYSNKEIFLRELISNSSDAADKLRFESLSNPDLLKEDSDLKIFVEFDAKSKMLTVRDNGIGMSREDVIEHLGTIAKSGTKQFVSSLTGDQAKDSQLIGKFGVGFYSAFMVADKIVVNTRKAGLAADTAVRWESKGDGSYSVENITKASRGTEVVLHLKKEEEDLLSDWRLRGIITKYSDHVSFPIMMEKTADLSEDKDAKAKKEDAAPEFEAVNKATALWTRSKSEITDEEYKEFYKHVGQDYQDPLTWVHNKVEGKHEYTSLLYIPTNAPFDLWDRDRKSGLKLYIKRVFVMDNADLLPPYLRFVKGLIDSDDLPLNVSREILQSNALVEKIKAGSVKKVLNTLTKMAKNEPEQYAKFWKAFGAVMKEAPGEDTANKEQVAKLLRFSTTTTDSEEQTVSLEEYVSRMKEGQKHIYYVTAENFASAKSSPHLEIFRKKGVEVILLSERVDEWLVSHLAEFDGKKLHSVAKGELDLGDADTEEAKKEEKAHKAQEKDFESVVKQMTEVLGDKVKEVRVTHRLTDSPACVVVDDAAMSMNLQRMMAAAGQAMPMPKPIFEINPDHDLVSTLKGEQDDAKFADWTNLLFGQSMLAEGGQLEDPASFVSLMNKVLKG